MTKPGAYRILGFAWGLKCLARDLLTRAVSSKKEKDRKKKKREEPQSFAFKVISSFFYLSFSFPYQASPKLCRGMFLQTAFIDQHFSLLITLSSMTIQTDHSDVGKSVDKAAKPLSESDAKLISTDNRHFSMVR
jgi:hypothetical protein